MILQSIDLSNKKTLLKIAFLASIILGLVVAVVLIQQRTRFLPKATSPVLATCTSEEILLKAIGTCPGNPGYNSACNRDSDQGRCITVNDYLVLRDSGVLGSCVQLRDRIEAAFDTQSKTCNLQGGSDQYDKFADIAKADGTAGKDGVINMNDRTLFISNWNDSGFCSARLADPAGPTCPQ